jgi:hypothetical protein
LIELFGPIRVLVSARHKFVLGHAEGQFCPQNVQPACLQQLHPAIFSPTINDALRYLFVQSSAVVIVLHELLPQYFVVDLGESHGFAGVTLFSQFLNLPLEEFDDCFVVPFCYCRHVFAARPNDLFPFGLKLAEQSEVDEFYVGGRRKSLLQTVRF